MFAISCSLGYVSIQEKDYKFVAHSELASMFLNESAAQRWINKNPEIYKHRPIIVEVIRSW